MTTGSRQRSARARRGLRRSGASFQAPHHIVHEIAVSPPDVLRSVPNVGETGNGPRSDSWWQLLEGLHDGLELVLQRVEIVVVAVAEIDRLFGARLKRRSA